MPLPNYNQCHYIRSIKIEKYAMLGEATYWRFTVASLRNTGYLAGVRRVYLVGARDELESYAELIREQWEDIFSSEGLEVVLRYRPGF
jgi:hypothetical protein